MSKPKMKGELAGFMPLALWANKHGRSKSAAMKLYRQERIPGAKLHSILGVVDIIVVPENTPWPKPAKPGTLTKEQRAAWPKR